MSSPPSFVLADLFRLDPLLCGKIESDSEGGCWLWTAASQKSGQHGKGGRYGRLRRKGVAWLPHRWVWWLLHGSIPPGWEVHHECGVSLCCNPAHLACLEEAEHELLHADELRRWGGFGRRLRAAVERVAA